MKVIAPIDGEGNSQAAIDALMGMNWRAGTQIKLLRVVSPADSGTADQEGLSASAVVEANAAAKDTLHGITTELRQLLPECEISSEVYPGDPKTLILGVATDWSADLIVMGSRGNTGLELLLHGSVSQEVLNHSPCPVLIVKTNVAHEHNIQTGFKNILLTIDDSAYGRAALNWVKKLSWSADARVTVVTVVEALPANYKYEQNPVRASRVLKQHDLVERAANTELHNMAQELTSAFDISQIFMHVEEGDPAERITYLARAWNTDLVVLGSHGRGGLTKLVLGSVSQSVSVQAPCAVAVVRGLVKGGLASKMQQTGMFKKPAVGQADLPPEPSLLEKLDRAESPGRVFFSGYSRD